jgi:hypothetical protein
MGGAWLEPTKPDGRDQPPMNSHNKRIIGIGTPSSQSKIPRPIMISLHSSWTGNAGDGARFLHAEAENPQ